MQGSHIWKAANKQRALIQQHNFWEIKAGDKALFWEDSWKQLPSLKILVLDHEFQNYLNCNNNLMVNDLWTSLLNGFRSWKDPSLWNSVPDKNLSDKWLKLCTRKIKHRQGSDIIR